MSGAFAELAWPASRLGEALQALARRSGLVPVSAPDPGEPPYGIEPPEFVRWIEAAASVLGIEAEPVEATYQETEDLVRRAGPALLRLPGDAGFVVLLRGGRRTAVVLDSSHVSHRVGAAELAAALRVDLDARLGPEVDRMLAEADVAPRRRGRARAAVLAERLSGTRIGGCWALGLPAGGDFGKALRRAWTEARLAMPHDLVEQMVGFHPGRC